MNETNAQKIKRYYTVSKVNYRYKHLVGKHIDGLLEDDEFIFECRKIESNSWRKSFTSLENVRDEYHNTFKKVS